MVFGTVTIQRALDSLKFKILIQRQQLSLMTSHTGLLGLVIFETTNSRHHVKFVEGSLKTAHTTSIFPQMLFGPFW